jgi:hypothetical protein
MEPFLKQGGVGVRWGQRWLGIEGGSHLLIQTLLVTVANSRNIQNQRRFFGMSYGMYKTKTPRRAH